LIYDHPTEFHGLKVVEFGDDVAPDFKNNAMRISIEYDEETEISEKLEALLAKPGSDQMKALLIGMWGSDSDTPVDPLIENMVTWRNRMPALEALFLGDIVSEENEISWIRQGDVAPLWGSFPKLREVRLRGGDITVGHIALPQLERLFIESGGLSRQVIADILQSNLPELRHLEIYTGDENYGADSSIADFAPLLTGDLFPKLTSLALRNSEYTDDIAKALAKSPLLDRIDTLDLSLGTLGDEGAQALLDSGKLNRLKKIDFQHHYLSDAMMEKLKALGVDINLEDQEDEDDWGRNVAVGE
jgi:hypothetical protein